MKPFSKMICILLASAVTVISCRENDETVNNSETGKISKNYSNSSRILESENIKVKYNSEMFEVHNNNTVSYYNDNIYLYDAALEDSEMDIKDNLSSTGEVIITNPKTAEEIILYNITYSETQTFFDVKTNKGHIFTGLSAYTEDISNGRMMIPIVPIIRAIGAIGIAVGVLVSGNTSQSNCQSALGSLNCPKGSSPYMTYNSGWFSSSCQVGCH